MLGCFASDTARAYIRIGCFDFEEIAVEPVHPGSELYKDPGIVTVEIVVDGLGVSPRKRCVDLLGVSAYPLWSVNLTFIQNQAVVSCDSCRIAKS